MAVNHFYPFATATSNITPQEAWNETNTRAPGNVPGTLANSALNNKALRQGTQMAAALGEYIQSKDYDAKDLSTYPQNDSLADNLAKAIQTDIQDAGEGIIQSAINSNLVAPANLDHNKLTGRMNQVCHDIASIQGLQEVLDELNSAAGTVNYATTDKPGIVEIATQSEVNGGSSTNLAVTPNTLRNTTFSDSQIPYLSADKIASGTFSDAFISSLNVNKLTGTFPLTLLPDNIPASKITGTLDPSQVPAISVDNIPNLPASKVTSGVFDEDLIPLLSPDKVRTDAGTFPSALIPNFPSSKITDRITTDKLPSDFNVAWENITGDLTAETSPTLFAVLDTKELKSNKTTSITSASTDTQYPSAKAIYDYGATLTPTGITFGANTPAGNALDNASFSEAINTKVPVVSGIVPGTYTKVTYNANGLVTSGTTLTSSDLPSNIPASKISGVIPEENLPEVYYSRIIVTGSSDDNDIFGIAHYDYTSSGTNWFLEGYNNKDYSYNAMNYPMTLPTSTNATGYVVITVPGITNFTTAAGTGFIQYYTFADQTKANFYVLSIERYNATQIKVNVVALYDPQIGQVTLGAGTMHCSISYSLDSVTLA